MDDLERLSRAATELSERETRHLARIRELEAALRALVATEPRCADLSGEPVCAYCYGWRSLVGSDALVHEADCPWLTAKALLGEEENRDG
jgi:hypothetical protein